MTNTQAYRIIDEPRPSGLSRFAVNPVWPLLGIMFVGSWLVFPWFAFNAFALGAPKRKLLAIAAIGVFPALLAIIWALGTALYSEWIGESTLRYLILSLVAIKLGAAYWLYYRQAPAFEIFSYYQEVPNTGIWVLAAAYFLEARLIGPAIDGSIWSLIL